MTRYANDAAVRRELWDLEVSLLEPNVRKSDRLIELLADEFIEFASSGKIYTKPDLAALLQAESPVVQTTSDSKVELLSPDAALITYRVRRDGDPPVFTLRSSVWRRKGGRWQMVFHHATLTPVKL